MELPIFFSLYFLFIYIWTITTTAKRCTSSPSPTEFLRQTPPPPEHGQRDDSNIFIADGYAINSLRGAKDQLAVVPHSAIRKLYGLLPPRHSQKEDVYTNQGAMAHGRAQ
jgi:hypothetical protein